MTKIKTRKTAADTAPQVVSPPGAPEPAFAPGQPRPGSKQALVVDLLSRPYGATLPDLVAATGWLAHTTRAALTGLRKRGYAIERVVGDDGSVYRITVQEPEPAPEPKRRSTKRRGSKAAEAHAAA